MPVLDKYRQIQSQLAAKKARWEELSTIQDQALTHIDQNIKLKPEVNPPVVPPVVPPVNNEPTTPEIVPQAPITPEPVVPPVVGPIKQETPVVPKPIEAPKETPMTPEDTVKQAQSWIWTAPPKGFEYGNMIDPKTGQPQLVNTAEIKRQKKLTKNRSLYTSGQSLYDWIKSGNILPWTDEFADLQATNPQVFADYEAIKKQEQEMEKVKNVGKIIMGDPVESKQSSTLQELLDKVSSGLDEDIMTQYKNIVTNNEDYVNANTKVTDLSTQLAKVNNDMNVIGEDMRKKITGETPESVIASKIAREAKPLLDKATYLQNQLEIAQADANRIMADNKGMFELQMADRADKRNLAFQLYGTINAAEIRKEDVLMADEELKQKMEQAKTEQEYLQYKDERDYNFKVAEAIAKQEESARDFTLKQETAKKDYELKAYEAQKQKASDFLKFETTNEDGTVSTAYRNPFTWDVLSSSQVFWSTPSTSTWGNVPISDLYSSFSPEWQALLSVPDGTVVPTRLGEVSPQNASIRGKECAEYVNDIYGTKIWSTYADKTAVCNETTWGVGSVAAWKPQWSGNFWHVGVIVDEDVNNYYIKSSNYTPWTVTTVPVPKANIKNFYTPESIKSQQTNSELNGLSTYAKIIAKWGEPVGTPAQKSQAITQLEKRWFFDKGTGNSNFYTSSIADRDKLVSLANMADKLSQIEELYNNGKTVFWQHNLGWYDQARLNFRNATWTPTEESKNFTKLSNLVGKNLSAYIKDISGATVSPSEADRLERNVPSMSNNETTFESSLAMMQKEYENLISAKLKQFGFKDIDALRNSLWTIPSENSITSQYGK